MTLKCIIPVVFGALTLVCCKSAASDEVQWSNSSRTPSPQVIEDSVVYKTDDLVIVRLTSDIYQHISFLNTSDYGKVACNGMVFINSKKGVVFDTPVDRQSTKELLRFLNKELEATITAAVPTHFHVDCVGGIKEFEERNIPIHALKLTVDLLKKDGLNLASPIRTFDNKLTLNVGDTQVYVEFFGEGHTKDNIIGFVPEANAIFGGCLIKGLGAGKGNLADANIQQWSETVKKIKTTYPNPHFVIPGHGKTGGAELLDYTITLFEKN